MVEVRQGTLARMVVIEVRQGTLWIAGRSWTSRTGRRRGGGRRQAEGRTQEEDAGGGGRRRRRTQEATLIKSNNPHLAGGELVRCLCTIGCSFPALGSFDGMECSCRVPQHCCRIPKPHRKEASAMPNYILWVYAGNSNYDGSL